MDASVQRPAGAAGARHRARRARPADCRRRDRDRRSHQEDSAAHRLATIPEIAAIIATQMTAMVPDPSIFRSGRDLPHGSGSCRSKLDRRQDPSRRHLQTRQRQPPALARRGAMAARFRSQVLQDRSWLCQLRVRKPVMVAAVRWLKDRSHRLGRHAARRKLAAGERRRPDRTSLSPCSPPSGPYHLRRWPSASLDRGCARRLHRDRSGRRKRSLGRAKRARFARANQADGIVTAVGRPDGPSQT